jgi:hypothetical protein
MLEWVGGSLAKKTPALPAACKPRYPNPSIVGEKSQVKGGFLGFLYLSPQASQRDAVFFS